MNTLLAHFLQEKAGVLCTLMNGATKSDPGSNGASSTLVLIDFMDRSDDHLPSMLLPITTADPAAIVALFNVDPGCRIEKMALKFSIRGVFYLNASPETMVKGVKALLKGELWFSRKVTTRLLLQSRSESHSDPAWNTLTRREKEILKQLSSGCNNQQIAGSLCISLHTVKTHLYNIYKKINVENRLQAMLWMAHHTLS